MLISLIVAMGQNRVIGINNRLPWRLPAEMRYFRDTTMGKPIIMGRKTHESIGRALPGRQNIILTRSRTYESVGCTIVHSVQEALAVAKGTEVMVIGGAQLYELFLPLADRIYLTQVETEFEGDSFFPRIDRGEWSEISRETFEPDGMNQYQYNVILFERNRNNI
jgi:dihydrofolate reductase